MKHSRYYKAGRKVIKNNKNDVQGYLKAIAAKYCEGPDQYVKDINSMLYSIKKRGVWQ